MSHMLERSAAEKGIADLLHTTVCLWRKIFHSTATIGKHAELGIQAAVKKGGTKDEIIDNLNAEFWAIRRKTDSN